MDSIYSRTTEDSLVDLAKAGFNIDVEMKSYGGALKTRVKIAKGTAAWGGLGIEIIVEAEDVDGAAALRGAVAAVDTYMHAVPGAKPEPSLPAPEVPVSPIPQLAEILDPTDLRRERNRPHAEAGNAVRECEDAGALSLR